ncbi:uncharacterized protein [Ptychodera flava]|uniref:uncharacterized protein isoform X2 n=1 Tax=Ptychodera flava TaxID=63121 RepID=UPI00396A0DE1
MLQLGYHFHSVAMDGLNHMSQKGVYMSNVDSSAKYDKTSSIFQASSQDFMSSNAKFDLSPFSRNYNVYSSGRDTPPPKLERFDESSLAEHQVNGLSPPVLTPNTAVNRKSVNFQADYQRPNYGSVVSLCSISDSPSSKTGEFQHFDFKTAEQFNRVQSLPSSLSAKTPSTPRAASRKIGTQLQKGTLPGTLKHNAVSVDILSDTSEEELPNFGYLFKHKHSKDSAVVIDHKTSPGQLAVTHRKNGVHSLISPIKNSAVERADFGNVSDIPELIHRKDSVSPCHGDVYPVHWESDRLKGCIDRNITASSACVSTVQNTNGTVSPLANGKVHEKRGEKRKDSVNNLQNGCSPKQKKVSSVIHNTDGATVLHNSKQPNEKFDINGNLKMCFDKKMHEKRKMLTSSEDVRNRYRAENFNGEPTANLAKSQSNNVSDVDFGKTNKLGTCTSGQNRRGHCIENEILHHSQLQSQGQRSERSCHQYNRDTTPDSKTLKNTVNGHHRMNCNKLSLSERNIKKTHQEKVGLKANGHQNPKVQKVRKPESVRHGHEKLTNGEVKTKVSVNQSKPVSQPVKSCPASRQMKSPVSPKTQSQPNPMKLTPSPTKPLLNQAKLKTGPIKKSSSQSQVAHMEHSKNVLSSSRKAKPNDSAIEAVKPSKHQQKTVPFPNQPKFSSKTVSSDAKPVTGFEKSLSLPAKSEKVEKIHNASRNPKSVLTEKLSSTNTLTTPNRPASGKTTTSRFMKKQSGKHRSSPVTSESYQSVILLSSASDSSDSERTLEDKQPILHTLTRELLQRSEFQRKKSTTGQSNGKMNPSNGKMNPSVPQVGKQIKEEHSSKLNAAVLCKKEESETESPVIPRKRQESMFIVDEIILDSSSDSDSELVDTCFDARGKKSGFDHDSDLLDINFDVLRETNRSQEKTKHVTPSSSGQKYQRTQKPEKIHLSAHLSKHF